MIHAECDMLGLLFRMLQLGHSCHPGILLYFLSGGQASQRIVVLYLTSRWQCWCTEQCSKMPFGNLTLLLCKTCGAIFYCFVHQHGRLITWIIVYRGTGYETLELSKAKTMLLQSMLN